MVIQVTDCICLLEKASCMLIANRESEDEICKYFKMGLDSLLQVDDLNQLEEILYSLNSSRSYAATLF